MTSGADERGDEDLRRLIRLTRDTFGAEAVPTDEGGLARLRAEREAPARGRRFRWPISALVAIVAVAGLLGGSRLGRRPAPLTFEIVQGSSTHIQFSDGSEVVLPEGARAEVRNVDAYGGTIVLGRGRAWAGVVTHPHTRWRITAGPYDLETAGTDADIDWSDTGRALELWVRGGLVKVSGPMIGAGAGNGMVLAAGQHLATRIKDDKIVLDAWDPAASRLEGTPAGH
jgi:ferric-dicitrate binding protein FerR (iron transport regulator)